MIQDPLNQDILSNTLKPLFEDIQIHVLDSCDSTNTIARELALAGVDTALVVANQQTAGRGRMGRQFYSPDGVGIYLSLLFPVRGELADALSVKSAIVSAERIEPT